MDNGLLDERRARIEGMGSLAAMLADKPRRYRWMIKDTERGGEGGGRMNVLRRGESQAKPSQDPAEAHCRSKDERAQALCECGRLPH